MKHSTTPRTINLIEEVILVDEHDRPLGTMEKMQVHEEGKLHRAFSIFLFNSKNELLLHQRADDKYHSGGLWTNTCCSHPRPGETLEEATTRRLEEEMGMTAKLKHMFHFTYRAELDSGLTEHELDHVFFGYTDDVPTINTEEVQGWKYIALADLIRDLEETPEDYTAWFQIIFDRVRKYMESKAA